MNTVILAEAFADSPLGASLVGVAATALVAFAVAVLRLVVAVSNLAQEIKDIKKDVKELKNSKDIMRYSDMRPVAQLRPRNSRQQRGPS